MVISAEPMVTVPARKLIVRIGDNDQGFYDVKCMICQSRGMVADQVLKLEHAPDCVVGKAIPAG